MHTAGLSLAAGHARAARTSLCEAALVQMVLISQKGQLFKKENGNGRSPAGLFSQNLTVVSLAAHTKKGGELCCTAGRRLQGREYQNSCYKFGPFIC